ncbi:MAG: hypothetical protein WB975_14770 [Nitrososphaeraceae archaeon]
MDLLVKNNVKIRKIDEFTYVIDKEESKRHENSCPGFEPIIVTSACNAHFPAASLLLLVFYSVWPK